MPTLSDACPVIVTVPLTVEPFAGLLTDPVVGGVVSEDAVGDGNVHCISRHGERRYAATVPSRSRLGVHETLIVWSVAVALTSAGVGGVTSFLAGVVTETVAAGERLPCASNAWTE